MAFACVRELSSRRACELAGVSRRRLWYRSRRKPDALLKRLLELARANPRKGYRMLHAMLKREGYQVNVKRVRRLCRRHGLTLSRKKRRKRRGIGMGVPCRAEYPNQVWAYDFVHDICINGRKLKVLTVEDEFTRQVLAIEVDSRFASQRVWQVLRRLFARQGTPGFVRSDNGPEFIAKALVKNLAESGVQCRHIDPGSPWQNGLCERFNGTVRDECLNLESFYGVEHARALCRIYLRHYNQERPHSALGYQTPQEFAVSCAKEPPVGGLGSAQTRDLSHGARMIQENGPAMPGRPDHPLIHVGAPVASQQSRVLRVDESSVTTAEETGNGPASGKAIL